MRTFNCRSASLSTCHHQHVFNHVICPYWTWLRICLVHSYRLQCHIMWPHPCKWHCTPQSRRHTHTKLRWTKNALVSALSCLMSPMSPFQNVLDSQAWIQFEASTGTMQLPNLQFLFVLSLSLPPSLQRHQSPRSTVLWGSVFCAVKVNFHIALSNRKHIQVAHSANLVLRVFVPADAWSFCRYSWRWSGSVLMPHLLTIAPYHWSPLAWESHAWTPETWGGGKMWCQWLLEGKWSRIIHIVYYIYIIHWIYTVLKRWHPFLFGLLCF